MQELHVAEMGAVLSRLTGKTRISFLELGARDWRYPRSEVLLWLESATLKMAWAREEPYQPYRQHTKQLPRAPRREQQPSLE